MEDAVEGSLGQKKNLDMVFGEKTEKMDKEQDPL